jgi:hypothetical protein
MRSLFIILICSYIYLIPVFNQEKDFDIKMIEVIKDTLFIPKQSSFNSPKSRKVLQFDIPSNYSRWCYYFESVKKQNIEEALSTSYINKSDFMPDSSMDMITANGEYAISVRKFGAVKLEVLVLDKEGADKFLQSDNGFCTILRPDVYFESESTLCEVGNCYGTNKVIIDNKLIKKCFLGFRNIDYREDAYIVVQVMAIEE